MNNVELALTLPWRENALFEEREKNMPQIKSLGLEPCTCSLTTSQPHPRISTKTHQSPKVKLLFLFLQCGSIFHFVLAKIQLKKQVNGHYFQPFTPCLLSIIKKEVCILHHIAFLFCLPAHYFLCPISHFQPPKPYFLGVVLPFSAMCFMSLRGYIYTIAVCFYAFHFAFCSILHCIQHHFILHLASKRKAFCTKTHCVQHQNALCFAANSPKTSANAVSFK